MEAGGHAEAKVNASGPASDSTDNETEEEDF
jgi:hypothetical protein